MGRESFMPWVYKTAYCILFVVGLGAMAAFIKALSTTSACDKCSCVDTDTTQYISINEFRKIERQFAVLSLKVDSLEDVLKKQNGKRGRRVQRMAPTYSFDVKLRMVNEIDTLQ